MQKRIPVEVQNFTVVIGEKAEDLYARTPAGWLRMELRTYRSQLCWQEKAREVVSFTQAYEAWEESRSI